MNETVLSHLTIVHTKPQLEKPQLENLSIIAGVFSIK